MIITDTENMMVCAHCEFHYMHIMEVFCSVDQDGSSPRSVIKIKEVRSEDKATLSATNVVNHLPYMVAPGRNREMSVVLRSWCEGCHCVTKTEFGFCKGTITVDHKKCGGKIDMTINEIVNR